MKRKYNTLNEEMSRMKSLFGESRLYGNLVDSEEKNILTEGYRFFDNLSDAFNLKFRSLDDLGKFTKFINSDINKMDDIVKHVREFPGLWKIIADGVEDWDGLLRNLEDLSVLQESNQLKNIETLDWYDSLPGYPQIGGMRDMIDDMWRLSKGKKSKIEKLPDVIDARIAVIDPKSGGLIIGNRNTETGVVVGTNSKGDIVTVEKSQDWVMPDKEKVKNPIEAEDVEFTIVEEGATMNELNNKVVEGNPKNKEIIDLAQDNESQLTGAVVNGSEEVKATQQLSPEQQIKLKELENRSTELTNRTKELDNEADRLKNAAEQQKIKDNPEGEPKLEPTGDPIVEVVVDPEKLDDWYSKTGRLLKLSWAARKKLLILKPKADESGFIRISKMVGSSIIDPLGIFSMAKKNLPPPKSLSAFDPGNVIATTPLWLKRVSRPLGGTLVNGLFWSIWLGQEKLPNPFTIFGYESDPNKYYFGRIYLTYWNNLKLTPLVRYIPLGIEEFGESQWGAFELEFSEITGKTIKEWENDYVKMIPEYTQSYYDGLSCDELIGLRGDDGKLTIEGNNSIANACSQQYNELMDSKFKEFEQESGGRWLSILSWITGQKIEMSDIASSSFKNVKGKSGDSVIVEQLNITTLKRHQPGGDCYKGTNDGGTENTKVVYVRQKVSG